MASKAKIGVLGASGYTGSELVRMLLRHPRAEIALLTARKARLQKLVADGDRSAAAALALGDDPTRFLSTIQIGITSIGILNGIVGEAAFAAPLSRWFLELGVSPAYAGAFRSALGARERRLGRAEGGA